MLSRNHFNHISEAVPRLGDVAHLVPEAVQLALQVAALVGLGLEVGQQRHLLVDQLEAGLGLHAVRPRHRHTRTHSASGLFSFS